MWMEGIMSQEQFIQARELIKQKRFDEARAMLHSIDHPTAREWLAKLDAAWRLDANAKQIRRDLKFKDFYRTMSFVNALAHVANQEDHHPDLEVGYDYCRVRFSTHAINGLSENDFICAAKLDRLV
jgi:4a-hydroxytetrahydrobiopterin dehydratase